jgi:hypothetical protein
MSFLLTNIRDFLSFKPVHLDHAHFPSLLYKNHDFWEWVTFPSSGGDDESGPILLGFVVLLL